jgi:hypothetical protein
LQAFFCAKDRSAFEVLLLCGETVCESSVGKIVEETDSSLVRGHKNSNMALQWMLLGVVVVAEVVILLLLTAPLPRPLAQKVVDFVRKILQPGLAIVPFAIFQLLEVYWKYEHRITCNQDVCTTLERDRFQRSVFKSERNALLAIAAAFLYWLIFRVTKIQQDVLQAGEKVRRVKDE